MLDLQSVFTALTGNREQLVFPEREVAANQPEKLLVRAQKAPPPPPPKPPPENPPLLDPPPLQPEELELARGAATKAEVACCDILLMLLMK